jgi:hypothetical protein
VNDDPPGGSYAVDRAVRVGRSGHKPLTAGTRSAGCASDIVYQRRWRGGHKPLTAGTARSAGCASDIVCQRRWRSGQVFDLGRLRSRQDAWPKRVGHGPFDKMGLISVN